MSEQCNGQWHNYPDCDDCPMLGDTCDGSEEWNERQDKASDGSE
jgi:hypothetical protein